jgi:subtilase family serine protease
VISDGYAKVVSMSFGGCEDGYDSSITSPTFSTGAGDGITFVASSGDFGNECPTSSTANTPGVNYPASDPNVVGVGGNESDTNLTSPVAWNESIDGLAESATGGGVSAEFTLPPFQSGVSGLASSTERNVPDIAMPAVNVAVYQGGTWQEGVGTSWSAPEFAAMTAEIDQYCGNTLGNANTSLYAAFAAANSDFIDVTSGNNRYNGNAPSPYYTAAAGYDNTTGLGMPIGISIAESACGSTPAGGHRALPSAARRSGRGASSVAFTMNHPTDRAFSQPARPAVLHSATDLGERSSTASTRVQVVLTPAAARMGGDSNVEAILRAKGFVVTKTFADHLIVDAQGTTAQVERLFATSIHDYAQVQHGTRYAPTGSITVPATLAPFVSGVVVNNAITKHAPRRGRPARVGFHL